MYPFPQAKFQNGQGTPPLPKRMSTLDLQRTSHSSIDGLESSIAISRVAIRPCLNKL